MGAYIAETCCSEHGVYDGMEEGISVGVPESALIVRYLDAPQYQWPAGHELMYVVALANAHAYLITSICVPVSTV